ncbi:MAG: hypothetical protein AB7F75_06515 [Planctomycetota bacterium]
MKKIAVLLAMQCLSLNVLFAQDPLAEIQKVQPNDLFGVSGYGRNVSVYQDRMVSGSGNNESVYVYKKTGNQFTQEVKLVPSDGPHGSGFGEDSTIHGEWIAAGANFDANSTGAVYIFHLTNGNWVQTQKIVANDGMSGDLFGSSVEIHGNVMVIGALGDGDLGYHSGSAYIYILVNGVWTFSQKLLQPNGGQDDLFGNCVDVEGAIIAVNSRGDDDAALNAGAVLIYELVGGQYVFSAKIIPGDVGSGDAFGYNLSLGEGRLISGSFYHDGNGSNSGAAYIYSKLNGVWTLQQKLTPNDPSVQKFFGRSVAIHEGTAVVGAVLDNTRGFNAGAVYVFKLNGSVWQQHMKVFGSDTAANDQLGVAVDISASWVVLGGYGNMNNKGAAYIFHENTIVPSVLYSKLHGVNWDPLGFVIPAATSSNLDGCEFVLEARQGTVWVEVAREPVVGNQIPRLFDDSVVKYSVSTDYRLYIVDSLQFAGPYSNVSTANLAADLNNDGVINKLDKILFVRAKGSVEGGPNWNPQADLIVDGRINDKDERAFLTWYR